MLKINKKKNQQKKEELIPRTSHNIYISSLPEHVWFVKYPLNCLTLFRLMLTVQWVRIMQTVNKEN